MSGANTKGGEGRGKGGRGEGVGGEAQKVKKEDGEGWMKGKE